MELKPIHRWYVFPHSFTSDLVHALIDEWGLGPRDRILDPFVGAGTTVLAAKEKGIPAQGYDLSPLAVLAARVKVANYNVSRLKKAWNHLEKTLDPALWNEAPTSTPYPELVRNALPGRLLAAFDAVVKEIGDIAVSDMERDFLRLALFGILPEFSRAAAAGGWLRWVDRQTDETALPAALRTRVQMMLQDLSGVQLPRRPCWRVQPGDARQLPDKRPAYSAVITSPPYPNRHDYTRVFGVELMFGFLSWEETRQLRYQTFHSHPEARPTRSEASRYSPPKALTDVVARLREQSADPRITAMLEGYFLDMYLCLRELGRVCRRGARIALVVGNARYGGEAIAVDELTAHVGEQAGLKCEKLLPVRYRGNSAQQMGKFGRSPSRESIVILRNLGAAEGRRNPAPT